MRQYFAREVDGNVGRQDYGMGVARYSRALLVDKRSPVTERDPHQAPTFAGENVGGCCVFRYSRPKSFIPLLQWNAAVASLVCHEWFP